MSWPKVEKINWDKDDGLDKYEQVGMNQAIIDMTAEIMARTEIKELSEIIHYAMGGKEYVHQKNNEVVFSVCPESIKVAEAIQKSVRQGLGGKV